MRDFMKQVAGERLVGDRPGAPRAIAAAIVAGTVTAVVTYRLLRA